MSTKKIQILNSLIPSYDEALSETSTNAIQNKAVTAAINDLSYIDINLEGSTSASPNPINADTLGGVAANEYATKAYVDSNASSGKDGVSPTVSTSKKNGVTTLTITDTNGTKTASINDGTSIFISGTMENVIDGKVTSQTITFSDGTSIDIANGYTPVKGTDYFTSADKQEMIFDVKTEMENSNHKKIVAQSTAPTDTSVLWIDTSDDEGDSLQEIVNAVLASLPVYNGEVI